MEGLVLRLKLQYFGHLMQRADSLEKTLILGKIEGAADFFRARLLGSAKATASLKLVSALMLAAVALILSVPLLGL